MKVRVYVSLKNGVLDPQGRAIQHSLEGLGFAGVHDVRAGRLIELDVDDAVTDEALQKAYDDRFKDAAPQTEYHAAHILVATEEEANTLKAELAAGRALKISAMSACRPLNPQLRIASSARAGMARSFTSSR